MPFFSVSLITLWPILIKVNEYKNIVANYFTFLLPEWFKIMQVYIYVVQCPCQVGHFHRIKENNGVLNEFDSISSQTKETEVNFDF
jgi:hypothetical protein